MRRKNLKKTVREKKRYNKKNCEEKVNFYDILRTQKLRF